MKIRYVKVYLGANPSTCSMRVARALPVNPREITLALERPGGTARNVFGGVIYEIVPEPPAGELMRVSLSTTPPLIAEVTRGAVESLGLRLGRQVFASFKAAGVDSIR